MSSITELIHTLQAFTQVETDTHQKWLHRLDLISFIYFHFALFHYIYLFVQWVIIVCGFFYIISSVFLFCLLYEFVFAIFLSLPFSSSPFISFPFLLILLHPSSSGGKLCCSGRRSIPECTGHFSSFVWFWNSERTESNSLNAESRFSVYWVYLDQKCSSVFLVFRLLTDSGHCHSFPEFSVSYCTQIRSCSCFSAELNCTLCCLFSNFPFQWLSFCWV